MRIDEQARQSIVVASAGVMAAPWLDRTIWGMTADGFLSDLGRGAQSTILSTFMAALGLPPSALGVVRGHRRRDGELRQARAGWSSDRTGRRNSFIVPGYLTTDLASGIVALATSFRLILAGMLFGWLGRGIRGPLRSGWDPST